MVLQKEDRRIASVCQVGIKSVFDYLDVDKKLSSQLILLMTEGLALLIGS